MFDGVGAAAVQGVNNYSTDFLLSIHDGLATTANYSNKEYRSSTIFRNSSTTSVMIDGYRLEVTENRFKF